MTWKLNPPLKLSPTTQVQRAQFFQTKHCAFPYHLSKSSRSRCIIVVCPNVFELNEEPPNPPLPHTSPTPATLPHYNTTFKNDDIILKFAKPYSDLLGFLNGDKDIIQYTPL
jgi:hypothetical protein